MGTSWIRFDLGCLPSYTYWQNHMPLTDVPCDMPARIKCVQPRSLPFELKLLDALARLNVPHAQLFGPRSNRCYVLVIGAKGGVPAISVSLLVSACSLALPIMTTDKGCVVKQGGLWRTLSEGSGTPLL